MDGEDRREQLEAELEEETDQAFQSIVDSVYEAIDSEYHFRKDFLEELGISPGAWRESMEHRVGGYLQS